MTGLSIQQSGDSNPASSTTPGGDRYTLDAFGRITDQAWITTGGINTAKDRFQLGYDANGNVLYKKNVVSASHSELYHTNGSSNGYDQLNRLVEFSRGTLDSTNDSITGTAARDQQFSLTAVGAQSSVVTTVNGTGSTQNRTINSQNQYTAVSGQTSPTFDNNGNMTRDEKATVYTFDAWNRMASATTGSSTVETFGYMANSSRAAQTVTLCTGTATTTDSYYSSEWQVLEEDVTTNPGCGPVTVTASQYVWGLGYIDDLVLRDDDSSSGNLGKASSGLGRRIYVLQDANYNVTALTDTSGSVLERLMYDPYGSITVLTASWGSTTDSYGWEYFWQGGRYDTLTQLYNFRYRDYDPALGAWTEQDPLRYVNGPDVYQFVLSNPESATDPFGLYAPSFGRQGNAALGNAAGAFANSYIKPLLPNPVDDYNKASAQADKMFDPSLSGSDRVAAGAGVLGNAIMAAVDCVPAADAIEKGLAKGAEKLGARVAEDIVDNAAKDVAEAGEKAATKCPKAAANNASKIDRNAFKGEREAFWKAEAANNPGKYSAEDLARMKQGRAPIGPDGNPMELHHVDRTPEGGVTPMSRTDHRVGDNYKKNHP